MKKQVIIMQGISGSGKSTKAHEIAEKHSAIGCRVVSADDLFTINGTYNFDPTLLGEAHKQCMRSFLAALQNPEVGLVIVDNTNTTLVEMAPYYLDELLEGANQIQDLTFDSLARTRGLIEASKEVGTATIEELRRQKGQIEDIENEVDIIDSNLKRAERLLFNFSRRMATDRIIQVSHYRWTRARSSSLLIPFVHPVFTDACVVVFIVQAFTTINIVVMLGLVLYITISGKSLTASTSTSSSSGPPRSGYPTSQPTVFPPGMTHRPTTFTPPTTKPSFPGPSNRP